MSMYVYLNVYALACNCFPFYGHTSGFWVFCEQGHLTGWIYTHSASGDIVTAL